MSVRPALASYPTSLAAPGIAEATVLRRSGAAAVGGAALGAAAASAYPYMRTDCPYPPC